MFSVVTPKSQDELDKYYRLRWEVLRKPWGQPRGSEKDDKENESIHFAVIDNNLAAGVGRLTIENGLAVIRFMAVAENYRNKGIGKLLLKSCEQKAREAGAETVVLQARENAVEFYMHAGYELIEKTHLLFGSIQHYKMQKRL